MKEKRLRRKGRGIFLILISLYFTVAVSISNSDAQQSTPRISLLFVGDIMQHDSQIKAAYDSATNTYDYSFTFELIDDLLSKPDLTIGNLELTFAGPPFTGYPRFSAPDQLAVDLKEAGFDVLVTANNHSLDRNRIGLERTIQLLDSLRIMRTGTFLNQQDKSKNNPLMLEKKGFQIALLNYTYGTNGRKTEAPNLVNMINRDHIARDLEVAKSKKADAIIVFYHWGKEYERFPNQKQRELAEFTFKNGADLVVGSHPHVIQPVEQFKSPDYLGKNLLVAYSLGNMVSNQRSRYRDGGLYLEVVFKKEQSGEQVETVIENAGYHLVYVNKNPSPVSYQLVPAFQFEKDPGIIKNPIIKTKMKQFLADSRAHLSANNKDVFEYGTKPVYKIQIMATTDSLSRYQLIALQEPVIIENENGLLKYLLGSFDSYNEAEVKLLEIKTKTDFRDAFIVLYINNQRQ